MSTIQLTYRVVNRELLPFLLYKFIFFCIEWLSPPSNCSSKPVWQTDVSLLLHKNKYCQLISWQTCLFNLAGGMETCYRKGQSHARPLGPVSSGGHQDWILHSLQVWITLCGYKSTALIDLFHGILIIIFTCHSRKSAGETNVVKCSSKPRRWEHAQTKPRPWALLI